jgi:hypothetical protein
MQDYKHNPAFASATVPLELVSGERLPLDRETMRSFDCLEPDVALPSSRGAGANVPGAGGGST